MSFFGNLGSSILNLPGGIARGAASAVTSPWRRGGQNTQAMANIFRSSGGQQPGGAQYIPPGGYTPQGQQGYGVDPATGMPLSGPGYSAAPYGAPPAYAPPGAPPGLPGGWTGTPPQTYNPAWPTPYAGQPMSSVFPGYTPPGYQVPGYQDFGPQPTGWDAGYGGAGGSSSPDQWPVQDPWAGMAGQY